MIRFATPLLLLPAALLAAPPATRPATTHPTTIAQAKSIERSDIAKRIAGLAAIGPYDVRQILHIQLQDNRVVISSPLESYEGERLIKFRHSDDFATIDFHPMSPSPEPNQPRFIQFFRYDFRDPKSVYFNTTLLSHPGYAQIDGAWEYLQEGMRDVSIIDQDERLNDAGGKDDAIITLRVQALDGDGNETHKVELSAPDLKTLQRQHPAEVNSYLRPVLRELDAESILDVDPTIAWQVFAPSAQADPNVAAQVNALVTKLDAANFADREQAADVLKKLGSPAAIVLMQLDRSHLSAEQNTRIEDILAPYAQLDHLQAARLAHDPGFLLSALDSDDLALRQNALTHLNAIAGHPVSFDLNANPTQRHAAVDALRHELLPPAATQAVEKSP